jgi:MFS family permease
VRPLGSSYVVLGDPRYRRFLAGAISYSIGLWSFQTVIVWSVLEQTGSAAAVSILTIAITLPTLIFTLAAGTLADRRDPRSVMLVAQTGEVAGIALAIAAAATNQLTLPVAALLIFTVGSLDAFSNVPAMVYVGRLVEPRLMASALGLSGIQFGSGRIGGGIVAGVAFQVGGPVAGLSICLGAVGLSAVVVSTLPRLRRADIATAASRFGLDDIRVAVGWVRASPPALAIIALGFFAATGVYSYFALLPILARDVLGGSSVALGLLTSSGGVGVVIGALLLDVVGRRIGRGRAIAASLSVASVAFILLGASRVLPISMALMVLLTIGLGIYRVTCQLLLQALAPARIRGRVLATFELTFWGMFSIGTLVAGSLADANGAQFVTLACGLLTLVGTGVVVLVYRQFLSLDVDAQGRGIVGRLVAIPATAPADAAAELAADEVI